MRNFRELKRPETTVEYFLMVKGYGFSILEPQVYGAELPEDIIRELEQRKDIETRISHS